MGNTIDLREISKENVTYSRLLIYLSELIKLQEPQSISKEMADALLACSENRRSMKLEQIFNSVLDKYPDGVTIKDIDVMFNPNYRVDVLKILIAAKKRKPYSVIWPGRLIEGKLVYGEEGYLDYKAYTIADYDIICVK